MKQIDAKHERLVLYVGVVEVADLVTEMREVRHLYTRGQDPRKGIEYQRSRKRSTFVRVTVCARAYVVRFFVP